MCKSINQQIYLSRIKHDFDILNIPFTKNEKKNYNKNYWIIFKDLRRFAVMGLLVQTQFGE